MSLPVRPVDVMLAPVTEKRAVKVAIDKLREQLNRGAIRCTNVSVGWRGGRIPLPLLWRSRDGFWAYPGDSRRTKTRYWMLYGIEDVSRTGSARIVCQINPPTSGVDRRCAGALVTDGTGSVYLAHSGKIGGGSKGIGRDLFRRQFSGANWQPIDWRDGQTTDMHIIGQIGNAQFPKQLAYFINEVARIKAAGSDANDQGPLPTDLAVYRPEFSGRRYPYRLAQEIKASCNHGLIVECLRARIKALGHVPGNRGYCDLYTLGRNGRMASLFEIKTDVSRGSIYRVIGQLMVYGAATDRPRRRVAVFPDELSHGMAKLLPEIGISLLTYRWVGRKVVFDRALAGLL